MDNKIQTREQKIISASNTDYSAEQIAVIKNTVAKNTTDLELTYFLSVAKSVNLNPFTKEVWCYKDGRGNLLVFAGRDGHLKAAQQNRNFKGIRSCEVCENDEFSIDVANKSIQHKIETLDMKKRGAIKGAYAIVYKRDAEETIEIVSFDMYNRNVGAWKTHSAEMIKKVAETHALKKAFGLSSIQSSYDFDVTKTDDVVPINSKKLDLSTASYIDELIRTSTLDDVKKDDMYSALDAIEYAYEASDMIEYLKNNQDECRLQMTKKDNDKVANRVIDYQNFKEEIKHKKDEH